MLRRLRRVLVLILQPIRPSSDLVAGIQIGVAILLPIVAGLAPFLLPGEWGWAEAALVVVGLFALLSLRAAYRLQQDKDVLLGQTPLQNAIGAKIVEGNQLLRRLQRFGKAEAVPKPLTEQIVSWAARTIRDLGEIAPEVADNILHGA
jgi:hypothetical protein